MKTTTGMIISAITAASGKAPDSMLLFAAGTGEIEGLGTYLVDETAYRLVAARVARRGNDIVIDYEHQTIAGGKAPAAGWIRGLSWDPERGIVAAVSWTEEASGYIGKGEYRYFSPVFAVRRSDKRVAALHSVALTNAPRTNHLTPLLAKLGADFEKEKQMDLLKKLIAKLGLAETATEEDVVTAVADLKTRKPGEKTREVVAKDVLAALDLEEGDTSAVVASIHALRQKEKGMVSREEFDALQARLARRDADDLVKKGLAAGKVTPDTRDWAAKYAARDPKGFELFLSKAPVVIPKDKLPGKTPEDKSGAQPDEAVLNVAKMFGNSEEDLKKYAA